MLAIIFRRDVSADLQTWSVIAAGLVTVGYTISRTALKRGAIAALAPPPPDAPVTTVETDQGVQIDAPLATDYVPTAKARKAKS